MKKYVKEFCFRGLVAAWGGPAVLAVIYAILEMAGVEDSLTPMEAAKGILSMTVLAFTAGAITVVYQIERLPLFPAVLLHGAVLYADYLMMYLFNGWLADGVKPLAVFTAVFVAGYGVIWLIIWLVTRRGTRMVNRKLQ